jgi:hypothetical protein
MKSFDEDTIKNSRPSQYQQSVLSVLGITQWHLAHIKEAPKESSSADRHEEPSSSASVSSQDKMGSINHLRDALVSKPAQEVAQQGKAVQNTKPGLSPLFDVAETERAFVQAVVDSISDISASIVWRLSERVHLSETTLETPPIATLMATPALKKMLWRKLQTLL